MTKSATGIIFRLMMIFAVLAVVFFSFIGCDRDVDPPSDPPSNEEQSPTEVVYMIRNGVSDFRIIFAKGDSNGGGNAARLNQQISAIAGVQLSVAADTRQEGKNELLLGDTTRKLSQDLKAALAEEAAHGDHVWGFAFRDGQFAFYYNDQIAFEKGLEEFKMSFLKDGALSALDNTWKTSRLTEEKYKEELWEAKRLQLDARLEKVKTDIANASYNDASFGAAEDWQTRYSMPTDVYTNDKALKNEHPRLYLNKSTVAKLKTTLEDKEYENLARSLFELADSENFTGIFPETTFSDGETARYSELVLQQIEARAMAYLVTGHKAYGYEAVYGIKNAMLSLKYTTNIHMDVYHGSSHVMFILALVYDWCYDLLTEEDKKQLISGCVYLLITAQHFTDDDFVLDKNKPSLKATLHTRKAPYGLEEGYRFPPVSNTITGHASGPQILRDYIAVSVAFGDEVPSWWQYVGGKFYSRYLPVQLEIYKNGSVPSGTAGYAPIKIACSSYAAFAIKTATGEDPYNGALQGTAAFMMSHLLPNGNMIPTGDGTRADSGVKVSHEFFYLLAGLYNDGYSLQVAKHYSKNYTEFTKNDIDVSLLTVYPGLVTAICASCDKPEGEYPYDLPLYNYTKYPSGQVIVRNSWESDSIITMMKIFERTTVDHDGFDSGTFRIYYKGFLAGATASYDSYGTNQHLYFHQATVSSNGLLIYNPALKDTYGGWYSGSQRNVQKFNTLEQFLSGDYDYAKVIGVQKGYKKDGKTPHYAYIAGDLTNAYDKVTVDYVARKMLTVYTDDEKFPNIFFVYDNINSDSPDFKKTFLLHTVKEPTVDKDSKSATVINGEGKLVLQNITGADNIHKIGGRGFANWIGNENEFDGTSNSGFNGVNEGKTDKSDVTWGRVELTARGERITNMLNVMYVTDAGTTETLTASKIEGKDIVGAVIGNVCAVFTTTEEAYSDEFSFTANGSGTLEYFIIGLHKGEWTVKLGDKEQKTYTLAEEGGMIRFEAEANCKITVIPDFE